MSSRRSRDDGRADASQCRVYVGNLPTSVDSQMLEDLFHKFGTIRTLSVKRTVSGAPFAFIEYDNVRDAESAIRHRDGYSVEGYRLRVEIPFAARGGASRGPPRRGQYRVRVTGLPLTGSWQDLKDQMREAGDCVFADVYRDGTGVVEFSHRRDMDEAISRFNDSKFRSHEGEVTRIKVVEDDEPPRSSYRNGSYNGRSRSNSKRRVPSEYFGRRSPSYEGNGTSSSYARHRSRSRSYGSPYRR